MASFNKTVTFDECITIRHYDYDKTEDNEEKKGKDWQRTLDLTCREFKLSIEKGGCGGDWNILESKLDELEEVKSLIGLKKYEEMKERILNDFM